MSRKVEETVGGLVQSLLGGLGSPHSILGGGHVSTQPTLGFLTFLEKLQEARDVSREDERQVLDVSAEQWLSELSAPSCSAATMSAVLQRALVGASRGHIYPQLHIHGLKLTQAPGVMHKKMGYLYLSVCAGHSELSLLTTNALHKDLQSRDAIALLAAITALPSVMRGGLPPQLLHALCNCLHHPMSLVRRRACQVLYAGLSVWGAPRHDVSAASRRPSSLGDRSSPLGTDCGSCHDSQVETTPAGDLVSDFAVALLEGEAVPSLLQLLSDADAGVAIAATQALALLYQQCGARLEFTRNSVACSAAHLLTAAFNASLPEHYDLPSHHGAPTQHGGASHVQVNMLRALRQLCSGPPWENVPSAVVAALTPILTQVWGAGAPGVCMTLQEAVLLTLQLPRAATSAGLRNTAINTTLGFLKSPSSRLQLAAVTLLANNWPLLKDSVTPALLHAVVHNLHTTTSSIITNTTLHLLYTMANHRNYKSVVGTLVQYCSAASPSVLQAMLNKISKIVSTHADDALWCLQQLQPLLLLHPHPALCSAMSCLVSRDIRDGRGELVAPALQLLGSVLAKNPAPRPHAIMAASVLAPLNSARAPTAGGQDAGALLTDEYGLVVPDVVCAPFMSDDERTLLDIVNEKFINNVVLSEKYCDGDQIIFECLKKIGLFSEGFEERTVGIALSFINSPDVVRRSQAREALAWIRNKKLACRVLEAERQVRKNLEDFDWTLPYLEEYIVESLEKKNEMPYLPRSCSVHGDGVSLKPLVIKPVTEKMHGSLSVSPRSSQSCQSTPRLGSQSSFIVAQRPGHSQSLYTDRRSYAESYRSLDQASNSSCSSSRRASSGSSGLLRACRAPSTSTDLVTPATDASSSVDSVSNSVNSSLDGLHRQQASTLQPEFDILQPDRSKVGTLPDGAQPTTSAPKLLWSVEGRSPHLGASFVLPPEGDTIEVAAEAMEELRLEEEEVPSTAAALARALYAGLGSK